LSLSIGWGIRGNYGHEFGAMMPGALAAVAVCLFSGREDWRRRVLYFAIFGALGWGFGGSIAYMPVMGYAQSGHLPTQIYGFFVVFATGFLWAAPGGAGTAYPAVETRERLTALFRPLCWVFAFWTFQYFFEDALTGWYDHVVHGVDIISSDFRQKNSFYWLDSEWLEASVALLALCAFDLWDRRFAQAHRLLGFALAGAAVGLVVERILTWTGLMGPLLRVLVHYMADPTVTNPATGQPFGTENLMTNWPQLFFDAGHHLGWIFGLLAGAGVYFYRFGKWRSGASLLMHITVGSYIVFLIFPVFLSNFMMNMGGFRMMPPRGDSWANTVGALAGMLVYAFRNGLAPVGLASLVAGFIGGIGFMVAEFVKILAWMPGNPLLTQNPQVLKAWEHWRHANWHSICAEQGVGLLYGLGIAVAMGLLATRVKPVEDEPPVRRWTEAFSVSFLLNALLFVNFIKMLEDWTRPQADGFRSVPLTMKAPLFESINLSAEAWFSIFWLLISICTIALLIAHMRRPLAAVPRTWLGKGQLFYLLFLWAIVIANFSKALTAFSEQRIATEGLIMFNALIATFLILVCARDKDEVAIRPVTNYAASLRNTVLCGVVAALALGSLFLYVDRRVYGDNYDGWGGHDQRFGEQADWRVKPLLKNVVHR
jgi:hypothetical protein